MLEGIEIEIKVVIESLWKFVLTYECKLSGLWRWTWFVVSEMRRPKAKKKVWSSRRKRKSVLNPPNAMKIGNKENHPMIQPNMSPVLYRMCVKDTAARADALLNSRVGTARISVLFIINVFFSHINSSKFLGKSHVKLILLHPSSYSIKPLEHGMEWNNRARENGIPFHCSIPFHSHQAS